MGHSYFSLLTLAKHLVIFHRVFLSSQNAKSSRKTIHSLRDELAALTQNVAHLHAEARALQQSHKDEVEQLNDSYTKKIDGLEEDHRQKMANLEVCVAAGNGHHPVDALY